MSINRRSMLILGIVILVSAAVGLWLMSIISSFRLDQRQILFEFGELNTWTLTTTGFFIDSEGNVYRYTNDSIHTKTLMRFFREAERGEIPYTTSELFKYYGNSSQLVGTLDTNTLNEMMRLIQSSSIGVLSKDDPLTPVNCASKDAGIYTYRAYLYDSTRNTHTPVYLYTMGDIQEINLSQEGKTLHKWLETTCIENDYSSSCKPSRHICRP